MTSVYEEIQKRAVALQAKDPRLSQVDAEAAALRDPALYRAYVSQYTTGDGIPAPTGAEIPESAPLAPVVKVVEHPLAPDLLALATAFRPHDPTGEGMVMCRRALAELAKTVQAKKRTV